MPDLSLTDLVDVISASGTPKYTKVKQIKERPPYSPATDFYKAFRDFVLENHTSTGNKNNLDILLPSLTDDKKKTNYPPLVAGYKKWWGSKKLVWFNPSSGIWSAHGVDIRVNPELGLVVNGTHHLIKLYLKADPLSKLRVDIITHLMDATLSADAPAGCKMGVLDVRRSKLIIPTVPVAGLNAALDGELAYVSATWKLI